MTWEPAIFPIGSMSVRISGSTIGEVKLLVLSSVQLNTPLLPSGLINILSRALETGLFDVELDVFSLTLEIEAGSGVAVGAGFIVVVGDFMSPGEVLIGVGEGSDFTAVGAPVVVVSGVGVLSFSTALVTAASTVAWISCLGCSSLLQPVASIMTTDKAARVKKGDLFIGQSLPNSYTRSIRTAALLRSG